MLQGMIHAPVSYLSEGNGKLKSCICAFVLQLYTQDFYRDVVKPKLRPDGIFVTQSGPAGVLSSTEVFTAIHSTLHSVFPAVLPYAQHIPSYNDAWVRYVAMPFSYIASLLQVSFTRMAGKQSTCS